MLEKARLFRYGDAAEFHTNVIYLSTTDCLRYRTSEHPKLHRISGPAEGPVCTKCLKALHVQSVHLWSIDPKGRDRQVVDSVINDLENTMGPREFRRIRAAISLTRKQLAEVTGLASSTIARYESGSFAIPRGIAQAVMALEGKVNPPTERWAVLTDHEISQVNESAGWYRRKKGWVAYKSQEDAETAHGLKGGNVVQVIVRKCIEESIFRERWDTLKLA